MLSVLLLSITRQCISFAGSVSPSAVILIKMLSVNAILTESVWAAESCNIIGSIVFLTPHDDNSNSIHASMLADDDMINLTFNNLLMEKKLLQPQKKIVELRNYAFNLQSSALAHVCVCMYSSKLSSLADRNSTRL